MERIRIGNDIAISWALFENNGATHLINAGGASVSLNCGGYTYLVPSFSVQGNVVSFIFPAEDQVKTGKYKIVLTERNESGLVSSYDVRDAFVLVPENEMLNVGYTQQKNVEITSVITHAAIANIKTISIVESEEEGGDNVVTFVLTDGSQFPMTVKNGSKGEKGDTGSTGATGPKGDKGDIGERGPAGIDSVEAAIGTNDPTQAPSVDKELTEGVLSLTFNNIKGEKGDQGEPAVAVDNYVTVEATSSTTSATDVLPATGSADTVYRVSNWDGTQYDDTAYTEYGWYNGAYKQLATRTPGIDDEPTANSSNLVKSGGVASQISRLGQYTKVPRLIQVYCDAEGKLLNGINEDGVSEFYAGAKFEENVEIKDGLSLESETLKSIYNPEYVQVTTDSEWKIIEGTKTDGTRYIGALECDSASVGKLSINGTITLSDSAKQSLEEIFEGKTFHNEDYAIAARKRFLTYAEQAERGLTPTVRYNDVSSLPQIVHITDLHADWDSFARCVNFANKLGIGIINTGDIVRSHGEESIADYNELLDGLDGAYMHCIGNHDSWGLADNAAIKTKFITPYATKYGWSVPTSSGATYYTKTDTTNKIKYIVLNQWTKYSGGVGMYYSQEQIDFLVSELLNVGQGYGVVIVCHTPDGILAKTDGLDKFYQKTVYNSAGTIGQNIGMRPVVDIVDAFIGKASISESVSSSVETLSISADFSNVESNEFIAYICGHTHMDAICYMPNCTNRQLVLCSTTGNHTIGTTDANEFSETSDLVRLAGTYSEDAFNVYTFDRDRRVVKIVRIGSDVPFNMSEKRDYMEIDY